MTQNFEQAWDAIAAEYRGDFAYLPDHRYELLCMAAADNSQYNADGVEASDAECLALFAASLEGFTAYSEAEILEIC